MRRSAICALAAVGVVGGCAGAPSPATQLLDVRVESVDPDWRGELACEAVNAVGKWRFTAPGSVEVLAAESTLTITCHAMPGIAVDPGRIAAGTADARKESMQRGARTGAKVGSGAGVAMGVAAAPVMGPAFAVVLAVGSVLKGAEVGGALGSLGGRRRPVYPSPIVLRVRPVTEPVPGAGQAGKP